MSRTVPGAVAPGNRLVDPGTVHGSVGAGALVALLGLLGLGACDYAFGLERPVLPTVCGNFGDEEPVRFGDELSDVSDFTFNREMTRGFVRATQGSRTGPTPVLYNESADRWDYDPAFEANWAILQNNDRIRIARMARDNELFVAQQLTTPAPALHVFHYRFAPPNWVLAEQSEIAATTNSDATPGGELIEDVIGSNPPVSTDFLPIFRFDRGSEVRTVAIAVHAPGTAAWQDQERIGGESSTQDINDQHQPWSGALARVAERNRQVLVYAATADGTIEGSDLYIAEKQSGGFLQGEPLTNFNTEDEEVEPWVSEDCSMITFRRTERGAPFDGEARTGGTIYMAKRK